MIKAIQYVALAAAVIGAVDLLWGNTGQSPLPDAVSNQLTQQTDLFLIAIGGGTFLYLTMQ
jgi:hypothetical protein